MDMEQDITNLGRGRKQSSHHCVKQLRECSNDYWAVAAEEKTQTVLDVFSVASKTQSSSSALLQRFICQEKKLKVPGKAEKCKCRAKWRHQTLFYQKSLHISHLCDIFHSLATLWAFGKLAIKFMLYVSSTMMCLIKMPLYSYSFLPSLKGLIP